ncbi:hypothetical protein DTO013E5_8037 [Penicillium roqueforti]|uniref:Genomic scaffold, ProqFM164S04 n=1 Tax=Penicillium roqueforti (strain FM164) TaxID=1365484 RepID=W6QFC2_PENRF|nr:uncharacterized protein LCP9604111_7680 [Penicillium roqueforti]CDM35483.1 unnamed protein product [Penicillium roqueforti FM164]KAF9243297.1 hypothetical protein LCP9604111_7680 [Penicillium roqueforti]KAI1833837.1 hypothetical protein CBS147337_5392 [Penicillium roqueforti]KAI2685728.1 hypothetical protein CBS147355_1215 [Penicillium roqueforti]KAI2691917.1 hypothetical protein LCP963914a_11 [Penicillium roqueforti]
MRISLFLATALAALVTADETTRINYFGGGMEWVRQLNLHPWTSTAASVAGINAVATTYRIGCLSDAPKSDCEIATPWTMIQGPKTYSLTGVYTVSGSGSINAVTGTHNFDCTFAKVTESPSCSFSVKVTGTTAGVSYSTSTSTSIKNMPTQSYTSYGIDVTAGTALFTASQATKTPNGAAAMITAAPMGAAAVVAIAAML